MRYTLLTILFLFSFSAFAQLPGLVRKDVADTIYGKDAAFAVRIVNENQTQYEYYYWGDQNKTMRTIEKSNQLRVWQASKADSEVSYIDYDWAKSKNTMIRYEITPFKTTFGRYWRVLIDTGIDDPVMLSDSEGKIIEFISEAGVVNYFKLNGFELKLMMPVPKANISTFSKMFSSTFVGITVSVVQNTYYFEGPVNDMILSKN